MTTSFLLFQNLRRNPLRSGLTIVAFALPMAIFVAAISFVAALMDISAKNQQAMRLVVRHKTTLTNLLPEGMRRKIEAMDPERKRISAVCAMRWFGGRVPNTQDALTNLGVDADTFASVFSELGMEGEVQAKWLKDRQAAVVGLGPVERYKWKEGDRVTLESSIPPYVSLEFRIIKIATNPERANFFFFRRDYLEESIAASGVPTNRVNTFWIKCKSADAMRSLQTEIDGMFANSPDETKSEDENSFVANFVQAAGDIPGLMQAMSIVVLIIVALVAGNTMMMNFRDRSRELAVFKAIGFQPPRVFFLVLSESVILAMTGAFVGVAPTATILWLWPIHGLTFGPISSLAVTPAAVVGSMAMALGVGLVAGFWPAMQAMRLRTVDALRRVA